jgi:hypothetical protein
VGAVTESPSEVDIGLLEASRAAMAVTLRNASLGTEAQALEALPPAGVAGWASVWLVGLRIAKTAAERWGVTVGAFARNAFHRKEREEFDQLGRDLAAVQQLAVALIATIAGSSAA